MNWQPGASAETLRARASLLAKVREFFQDRGVLEVETPLLARAGVTDPAIEPLTVSGATSVPDTRYLQTSPEYAMKRLLAAGSGPIYQIARAFRDGEAGSRHNPEFTLLEWYRPGFTLEQLMAEVCALLQACIGPRPVESLSYREAFQRVLGLDPFTATTVELESLARGEVDLDFSSPERDLWLDLLMSHLVEPQLSATLVYQYPASQAALAQVAMVDGVEVALRFELFVDGLELANGYAELTDPKEQRGRFIKDNRRRAERGLAPRPLDEQLLAALEYGLPSCAGVALGLDRLLMLMTGAADIRQVLAFDWSRS